MRAPIAHSRGFTLIELMIAVTLGLIILAALTSFFVRTSGNRSEMERNARQIENGRYAVNAIRDDLMLAGFFADISQPSTTIWNVPAACELDPTKMGVVPAQLAPQLPVPVFVYASGTGAPAACTPDYLAGTDVIVVRRLNSEATTVAAVAADTNAAKQIFVQISECKDDDNDTPYLIDTGANSANLKLRKIDCKTLADVRRYREQLYYVRNYSVTAGDGIPTLMRVELDNVGGAIASNMVALVDGIESIKIDWGIDNTGDGLPDVWSRCDAAADCKAADWANVTSAKIYILSRNIEASPGYVDDRTYGLGLSGSTAATKDAFKRQLYSTQITLPNRAGPREPAFAS